MARNRGDILNPEYDEPMRKYQLKRAAKQASTTSTGTTPNQGIAVGEPNPATPRPRGGIMAGYTGPKPGTPEFKAARARGETPIRTYLQGKVAAKKAARAAKKTANPPARPTTPAAPRPGPRPPRLGSNASQGRPRRS